MLVASLVTSLETAPLLTAVLLTLLARLATNVARLVTFPVTARKRLPMVTSELPPLTSVSLQDPSSHQLLPWLRPLENIS